MVVETSVLVVSTKSAAAVTLIVSLVVFNCSCGSYTGEVPMARVSDGLLSVAKPCASTVME